MKLVERSRAKFLKELVQLRLFEKFMINLKKKHKYKFFVQPGDRIATHTIIQGLFEVYEISSLAVILDKYVTQKYLSDKVVALDIGANIGSHSVALAQKFHRLISFEPNPSIYKVLEANLIVNGVQNVTAYQVALGSREDILDLYESEEWNSGMGSLIKYREAARVISSVKVARGDDFIPPLLQENETVGFVKVDVEGHEIEVIRGLRNTLSKHNPLICLEISGDKQGIDIRNELQQIGYFYFYHIDRQKSGAIASKLRRWVDLANMGADFYLQPIYKIENTFYACVIASKVALV